MRANLRFRNPELDDLKKCACFFMVMGHVIKSFPFLSGSSFFLSVLPLGRISFPLFAWVFIVLSSNALRSHAKVVKKLESLFWFGVAIQPTYFLVFRQGWGNLNMMFTFASALIFAFCLRMIADEIRKDKRDLLKIFSFISAVTCNVLFSRVCDYGTYGTLATGIGCFLFSRGKKGMALFVLLFGIFCANTHSPEYSLLALFFILPSFHGTTKNLIRIPTPASPLFAHKYVFHIFYFLHVYLIWVVRMGIYGM